MFQVLLDVAIVGGLAWAILAGIFWMKRKLKKEN